MGVVFLKPRRRKTFAVLKISIKLSVELFKTKSNWLIGLENGGSILVKEMSSNIPLVKGVFSQSHSLWLRMWNAVELDRNPTPSLLTTSCMVTFSQDICWIFFLQIMSHYCVILFIVKILYSCHTYQNKRSLYRHFIL